MTDQKALLDSLRQRLNAGRAKLREDYESLARPLRLLKGQSCLVDGVLADLWAACDMPATACLIAVGGYGRGELYPYSDVDILILLADPIPDAPDAPLRTQIEQFIGHLWDLGLDIGHSVRTLDECESEATNDVTVQTSLLESRPLCGSTDLYQNFVAQVCNCLDVEAFFHAKRAEQEQRYNRFNDSPYALEPNCKESPGGLRDLQVIMWVALACGLGTTWKDLANRGLITQKEVRVLQNNERLLQNIRIRLHFLAKRREDRLIYDLQESIAKAFDIGPDKTRRASEMMMQRYYLAAKKITQLNSILLLNIATLFQGLDETTPKPINENFQRIGNLLDIVDEEVFQRHPPALLESFLMMQQHSSLKGMSARTLRALWRGRRLINAAFRRDPINRANFLAIFQQDRGQTHEFRRLNQYSILGNYLPAFGRIVGQMQHDLFHVYTVDQHILLVLRNVRRFSLEEHAHEYPLMTRLHSAFDKPWLLYIAALFHDIAKGRGGDHSKLGMADARRFGRNHGLEKADIDLVVWLVEQHLLMSHVAQKKDLGDPEVIKNFAQQMGSEYRLTALYLLTHADIRGTSPKVWNGWKDKLLEDLFLATRRLLRGDTPIQAMGVAERREAARTRLRFYGLAPSTEDALWKEFDTVYFMRHDSEEVAWHTRMLYHCINSDKPIVKARPSQVDKGLQLMVYTRDQRDLFARLCGYFNRMGFSILDAKIHTTAHGYALDSFLLMDANGMEFDYRNAIALIEHELSDYLLRADPLEPPSSGRLSRQIKYFPITPSVTLTPDERGQRYTLSIVATDRPGLLYTVARTLAEHGIHLHAAKIATLGERAEDTFLVSGANLGHSGKTVKMESDLIARLRV